MELSVELRRGAAELHLGAPRQVRAAAQEVERGEVDDGQHGSEPPQVDDVEVRRAVKVCELCVEYI